jgi:hypothetical protein
VAVGIRLAGEHRHPFLYQAPGCRRLTSSLSGVAGVQEEAAEAGKVTLDSLACLAPHVGGGILDQGCLGQQGSASA